MTLDREWEKFKGGPTVASRDRMQVTLGKRDLLYMNSNAHRILGRPAAVYLFFNRAKDTIGVQPASPRMPEAFPVIEKREGYIIPPPPFCRHFGICIDKTERFIRPDLVRDDVLLLELSNMAVATRPPRKWRK